MEKLHQYIEDLTEASRNGKLVFFVGAGLSTLSGYPQWWELVDKFYIELYGRPKESQYSSDEYLLIPQIFYDVKGQGEFDRILEDVFSVDRPINPIHDKILAMNPVHIITTNYDNLIETACWKRGRYFSVVSAEEDVAKATSSRYLLKVHGDFRRGYQGKNVVLKEIDYLNYEHNYPLISNLMKTIMATHTIVFIGYGLGDYNIKLLLNWVKKLQNDEYIKPFFIRTDPQPIEKNTAVYYESKGLRIIDAASIGQSDEKEYMKRYSAVMDLLIESRENGLLSKDDEVVEYIYKKLSPLFLLQSVRKLDLKHVFEYDYHFEVNGLVVRNKNKGFPYMERFFELKEKGQNNLSKNFKKKFEEIIVFFERNGILCMLKNAGSRIATKFSIESPAYHGNYDEMERIIKLASSNLEDDYRRAFYLACLGKWEDAYNLYSDILLRSIDESNWWIHYLSQINRYRLYQSITQATKQLESIGILAYGRIFKPFSDEFISRIEREMKNFNIDDVYGGMPYEFQQKYRILEFLSDHQFLYDDIVKLFELTNKVRSEMSKGTYSFGSLTSDVEVQCRLNENLRFLYENCLWLAAFKEFKQYMRNSLMLLFEKAEYDKTRDIDEFGISMGVSGFYVDYYDFVNVVRSFSIDDIKHIERVCKIERFEFRDREKIEEYLIRIADEIIKQFSNNDMDIVFYTQLISEAKVAFYFARYVKLSAKALIKIFKALLFYFPERDLDTGKRYLYCQRLIVGSGKLNELIPILEEFLIQRAYKHINCEFSEESTNGLSSGYFGNLIRHLDNTYVSYELSKYALALSEETKNQIDFIYRLLPILSSDARNHILGLKKVEDIAGLFDGFIIGAIENISEYQDLIIEYMEDWKLKVLEDRKRNLIKLSGNNDYFVQFGILYFLGELTDIRMKDYRGVDDEYDMFVSPESFDFTKFRPSWLKNYDDVLLGKIAQNEHMRPHVIDMLKERIKNTKDRRYIEIFLDYFST
ncbi:NAD-dependent protein deacetylases, SIR2 family [Paenibacillus barengoltzii]|uniref:SIR2 family protein n=1 Tax=Paenibacillus TaxID=44249 RepID=UPI0004918FA4|nr:MULTISPECIES: SIR2 family protein [Paenibacillus]SMF20813.1 NAD-dependent protein deacetylases, SIR2 family [Paenibacillus barengoltzii]